MPGLDELNKLYNNEEFIKGLILIAEKYFKKIDQSKELVLEAMPFISGKLQETVERTDNLRGFVIDQLHDWLRVKLMKDNEFMETLKQKAKRFLYAKDYDVDAVSDTKQAMLAKRVDELKNVEKHMQGYVYTVLKFICLNKNKEQGFDDLKGDGTESVDEEEPRKLKDLNECLDKLYASLKAASQRDALIFKMLREDYDNEEIAAALGISHGTARVAIHRLRQQIGGKCQGDDDL